MSYRLLDPTQPSEEAGPPPRDLVLAWREQRVDSSRVARAYLRFQAEPSVGARPKLGLLVRCVLLGVAIGMSSVYAASSALRALEPQSTPSPPAPSLVPVPMLPASPTRRVSEPPTDLQPPSSVPSTESANRSSRPAPHASVNRERWAEVARDLRRGDLDGAHSALDELRSSGSEDARESADLAQAQILISRGKEAEARRALLRLQRSARSPHVRSKCAELLAQTSPPSSERSFDTVEGTNSP